MAQKITSKNLTYDDSLPPFLARLRNQHAATADEPDPILASRRRAAKPRSASEEAEEGPLVVDEEGVTVRGVTVGKDGVVVTEEKEEGEYQGESGTREGEADKGETKERIAAIGGGRKRKAGKVVGGGSEEEEGEGENGPKAEIKGGAETVKAKKDEKGKEMAAKGKKKAKKIKLSFGDDDGE